MFINEIDYDDDHTQEFIEDKTEKNNFSYDRINKTVDEDSNDDSVVLHCELVLHVDFFLLSYCISSHQTWWLECANRGNAMPIKMIIFSLFLCILNFSFLGKKKAINRLLFFFLRKKSFHFDNCTATVFYVMIGNRNKRENQQNIIALTLDSISFQWMHWTKKLHYNTFHKADWSKVKRNPLRWFYCNSPISIAIEYVNIVLIWN